MNERIAYKRMNDLLPSLYEGLGIVLVEAQCNGLPSFTSKGLVPEEVSFTDSITFLELEKGPAFWANAIVHSRNKRESNASCDYLNCGYNIDIEAKRVNEIYLKLLRDE